MSGDWRPAARSDVTAVEIDDDLVVLDGDGQLHVLNPTATAVWRLCDGVGAVADIVAVISASFDTRSQPIEQDVADLLRRLLALRLVR